MEGDKKSSRRMVTNYIFALITMARVGSLLADRDTRSSELEEY